MQSPILVSGCARSGTSLVAQILNACGAFTGETVGPDPNSNPDGFFEHTRIREEVTKKILLENDCDPLGVRKLPERGSLQYPSFRNTVETYLKEEGYERGPWLYKDAKLAYMPELWMREFPDAKWVLTKRNPSAIVSSCLRTHFMKQHSGDPYFWGEWVNKTTERLQEISEKYDTAVIDTDRLIGGDFAEAKATVEWLGLTWDEEAVKKIVKPQHWKSNDVNTSIPLNTSHEDINRQVRACLRRQKRNPERFKDVPIHPPNPGEICIVGGGPSLKKNWKKVREMKAAGVFILALNGAHNFLLSKKVVPTGMAMLDARESNKKFVSRPQGS